MTRATRSCCCHDAFAWVTALSSSCHAAAADSTEGRWIRFTIHLTDEKLEELLRAGTLQMPDTPGRGPYRVVRAIPLESLVWEIQEHVVVPVSTGGTSSPKEMFFPGPWWHGRVGRLRSLGDTHFRPRVVDRALVLQENHPLRLCTIPRPFSDWSSDLGAADQLCIECAQKICADCGGLVCDWREDDLEVQNLSST